MLIIQAASQVRQVQQVQQAVLRERVVSAWQRVDWLALVQSLGWAVAWRRH
ncbi:hypothetical protein [Noviherbaspirillum sp.]|uniref:hypothetical protein n=1 Tax=Noviherbaspirillum sp. TaxID=1926288 RepID=UPI0025CD2A61|nr:hypothetical protein [Noviherbaspirillum sp.]